MYGCCYNPFLFVRRPMCFGFPQMGNPSIADVARMEAAANASTASLYPYSWYSNYGGEVQVNTYDMNLPLETVMHLQNMRNNPYYVPNFTNPNNYEAQQRMLDQAAAKGKAEGLKKVLKIKYTCTLDNINAFAQETAAALNKKGLTAEDKSALEAIFRQVEALKQKMIQYAQTSSNKPLDTAIADVEAMAGELLAIKETAKQLVQTIASRVPQQQVEEEVENPEEAEVPEQEVEVPPTEQPVVPPAPGAVQNPEEVAVADPDAVEDEVFDTDGKFKLDNENLTLEQVKETYNEYRTQLNEYLKTEGLSDADKQAIIDKSKELVAAIKENKPAQEAAKLYNELLDLVNKSAENITAAANQKNLDALNKALTEEIVPVAIKLINDPDISADDKKALKDKYAEVKKAINDKKTAEEVAKIYNELIELINTTGEKIAKARTSKAAQICSDIYSGSNGIDFSGKGEAKIKAAVNKITKDNVLDVLRQWEEGDYNEKTGDDCILDTIKHEFNWSTGETKKLINHILNCLKEVAKENDMLEAITPELATITGEMECFWWDEEKMYNAFNEILAKLGVKKVPGEQVLNKAA